MNDCREIPRIESSSARMEFFVDGFQAAVLDLSINLRRGDAGVSQHFLQGRGSRLRPPTCAWQSCAAKCGDSLLWSNQPGLAYFLTRFQTVMRDNRPPERVTNSQSAVVRTRPSWGVRATSRLPDALMAIGIQRDHALLVFPFPVQRQ